MTTLVRAPGVELMVCGFKEKSAGICFGKSFKEILSRSGVVTQELCGDDACLNCHFHINHPPLLTLALGDRGFKTSALHADRKEASQHFLTKPVQT